MNGRVYDPASARFASPDPFVQDPWDSQSFNRYAYVFNSPLSYTDPSGFNADDPPRKVVYCINGGCGNPSRGRSHETPAIVRDMIAENEGNERNGWDIPGIDGDAVSTVSTVGGMGNSFINDAADFSAGWGDLVSFGLTAQARELWDIGAVDRSSDAYSSGEAFGFVNVALTGYGAGTRMAARASSATGWSNFSHSLFPHRWLRRFNNPLAKWLDRTGNRLNGDFVSAQLHTRMDAAAQFGLSPAWLRANPLFSPLRQWINRIPYTPGSILYGTGSVAINCNDSDDCE
jgi:hypothetical protein